MKKLATMILSLLLVLAIAAPAMAVETALPLLDEKQTFTIMVKKEELCMNTWPEKECVIQTEEKTNVHVEWIEVPSSGWTEKVNLMFASGDLPDAIIGGVDVVANQDVLTPLTEYIERSAPNVLQMFGDIPEMRGALKCSDGEIYSLPTGDAAAQNEFPNEMYVNTVWLEKLGLSKPTTIDEMYDMLIAFRDQDPNGNGQADEIPMLATNSWDKSNLDNLFGFFGTLDSESHVRVVDSKVIFTPIEDAYFEALQWFHKLYSEKLINQEYFTEDYQQYLAKGSADPCITGVAIDWYKDNIITGAATADFDTLEPVAASPDVQPLWNKAVMPQGKLNGFVITTACKDPETLVKWYDYINSDLDVLNRWNYGPENVLWRYTDESRTKWEQFTDNVPDGVTSSELRRTAGTGPEAPLYAYARFRGPDVENLSARYAGKVATNQAYLKYVPAQAISNGFGDPDEVSERNMLLVDIDNYLNKFKANAIVNGITEEDWQKHLETISTLSLDEYVGYWQSYYDAHQ